MGPRGLEMYSIAGLKHHCRAGAFAAVLVLVTLAFLHSECWAVGKNDSESVISLNGSTTRAMHDEYPSPILFDDLNMSYYHHNKLYNLGVVGFEIEKFFSYAAYFCSFDALCDNNTSEIVSTGTGYGINEKEIANMHHKLFGTGINITRVSKLPEIGDVHFQSVDDLIANRPNIVRNCALLLIWPENESDDDIEAVRKLQPRAVLTLYETTYGASGSPSFQKWLLSLESNSYRVPKDKKRPKLRKYRIEEAVFQGVKWNPRTYYWFSSNKTSTYRPPPGESVFGFRLVRLKRADVKSSKNLKKTNLRHSS